MSEPKTYPVTFNGYLRSNGAPVAVALQACGSLADAARVADQYSRMLFDCGPLTLGTVNAIVDPTAFAVWWMGPTPDQVQSLIAAEAAAAIAAAGPSGAMQ